MLAVRVPPSACSTSQSMLIWRSPMAGRSTTARSDAADQALDLLGAARLLAARGLAVGAGMGRARQHAVFGGDPAAAGIAHPGRHPLVDRGGAQHVGVAELDQARALGMAGKARLEGDGRSWSGARPEGRIHLS